MGSHTVRPGLEDDNATLPGRFQSALPSPRPFVDPTNPLGRHSRSQVLVCSIPNGTKRADPRRPQPLSFPPSFPSNTSIDKHPTDADADVDVDEDEDEDEDVHCSPLHRRATHQTLSAKDSANLYPPSLPISPSTPGRSHPIAIPTYNHSRHRQHSSRHWASNSTLQYTPLTAREEKESYFPADEAEHHRPSVAQLLDTGTRKTAISGAPPHRLNMRSSASLHAPSNKANKPSPSSHAKLHKDGGLKLSGLPRFHPALFEAAEMKRPASPQQQQRQFYEAQRRLHQYQRELVANGPALTQDKALGVCDPSSPRLAPLGSPGPVTPMQLEDQAGYFFASSAQASSPPSSYSSRDRSDLRAKDVQRHRSNQPSLNSVGTKR